MTEIKKPAPEDFVSMNEAEGYADITLSRPATIGGAKVSTLRMREPTGDDLERFHLATGHEVSREFNTFANLCNCTPAEVRALPDRDQKRLQAAYTLFTN
jgi:hypothetical protein